MPALTDVPRMSPAERVAEAMRRSLPHLPAELRGAVEYVLSPASLAIVAGTLAVWAGSHLFGVGEIVDVVLLGVGAVALGWSVFEGSAELYKFATGALQARTVAELEVAGKHFAQAVLTLGFSTIQAILLRGQGRAVLSRGRPQVRGRIVIDEPPPPGNQLKVSRPQSVSGGALGDTNAYGVIRVARNQSMSEQRITLLHELVHRYLSPRLGPLRKLRAELRMSGYARSAFLRYLEEALAEGYAQLRVHGFAQAIEAFRFPIIGGYVVVSQLVAEGHAVGTIMLGGFLFNVSVAQGALSQSAP